MFILIHIFLYIWFFTVAYGRRREMDRLDRLYVQQKETQSKENLRILRTASTASAFHATKIHPTDSFIMIANGSTIVQNTITED